MLCSFAVSCGKSVCSRADKARQVKPGWVRMVQEKLYFRLQYSVRCLYVLLVWMFYCSLYWWCHVYKCQDMPLILYSCILTVTDNFTLLLFLFTTRATARHQEQYFVCIYIYSKRCTKQVTVQLHHDRSSSSHFDDKHQIYIMLWCRSSPTSKLMRDGVHTWLEHVLPK